MKVKYWALLLIPFFQACAAHAPMSELVMFDNAVMPDSVDSYRAIAVTYFEPGISGDTFEEVQPGDYASYTDGEVPSITLHPVEFKSKSEARSFSIGRGMGVDLTKQFRPNYFGSIALSFPHSAKLSAHRVIINQRNVGISSGFYTGIDSRRYYELTNGDDENLVGFPDKSVFLVNSGIRSRFLVRNSKSTRLTLTGALDVGYLWNNGSIFVGFNISTIRLQ